MFIFTSLLIIKVKWGEVNIKSDDNLCADWIFIIISGIVFIMDRVHSPNLPKG